MTRRHKDDDLLLEVLFQKGEQEHETFVALADNISLF
jgi:hypothetical protein